MRITNTFTVPVGVERAWDALIDVERVAPCMPGASLESFDGDTFTGTVAVKLGALSMKYKGSGRLLERDADERRVSFEASGRELHGSGTAKASVVATLHPEGSGTRVDVDTDLTIAGRAAQFGRGVVSDVAARLLGQFAATLADELGEPGTPPAAPDEPPAGDGSVAAQPATAPTRGAAAGTRAGTRPVEPIDLGRIGAAVMFQRIRAPFVRLFTAIRSLWRRG